MSSWLSSTNAKEIGTLYLIFAVFAGMFNYHAGKKSYYMLKETYFTLMPIFTCYLPRLSKVQGKENIKYILYYEKIFINITLLF